MSTLTELARKPQPRTLTPPWQRPIRA
jgi:hypothetical protein